MHCKQTIGARASAPRAISLRTPSGVRAVRAASGNGEDIYIGFPKGDYAPREGRKGRVIKDDPSKYPDKVDMGFFKGAVGGWAGGEAALWQFREEIKEELGEKDERNPKEYPNPSPKDGAKPIYVGFGKDDDDFKLRNSGGKGRVVYDVEEKYPAKEDVGPLLGLTGGFAGGERGLKGFVEAGDVKIRKTGEPGGQPASPVPTAFTIVAAGATGGLLLSLAAPEMFDSLKGSVGGLGLNLAIGGVLFAALASAAVLTRQKRV